MGYLKASPGPGQPPLRKTAEEIERARTAVKKVKVRPVDERLRNEAGNSSMLIHNVSKALRRKFHVKCLERDSTMTKEIIRLMKEFIGEPAIP